MSDGVRLTTTEPQHCPLCGEAAPEVRPTAPACAPFLRPRSTVVGLPTAAELDELRSVIGERRIRSHYQPIVELGSGGVVGHEALARADLSALPSPDAMFRAARLSGQLSELDWECARAGLTAADAALHPDDVLFLNSEPSTLGLTAPEEVVERFSTQAATRRVVVEISERSVLVNPAQLLAGIHNIRALGAAIALDDVGASADSLALMPFVNPDIIKLDMSLIQGTATLEVARLLRAVHAQVERTGAAILAEGIETEEHLEFAVDLGATLGQGWLFGRPGPEPDRGRRRGDSGAVPLVAPVARAATPFAAIPAGTRTTVGRVDLLRAVSDDLEDMAPHLPSAPVVLLSMQRDAPLTPRTTARLRRLADACTFVGLSADGIDDTLLPGVRMASHPDDRPGSDEWAVIVISSHFSGALLARALERRSPCEPQRFEYVISHDRQTVVSAGAALLRTITDA